MDYIPKNLVSRFHGVCTVAGHVLTATVADRSAVDRDLLKCSARKTVFSSKRYVYRNNIIQMWYVYAIYGTRRRCIKLCVTTTVAATGAQCF